MHYTTSEEVLVFVIACSILILFLIFFIALIVYKYQQKQFHYFKEIEEIKANHDNAMLASHTEIQEQTFQNISREIHDNIGQKLTLSKLYLNLTDFNVMDKARSAVSDSVKLISEVIVDLSDISRGISSEIVLNDGLIHAIEHEIGHMQKSGLFKFDFDVKGESHFLDYNTELVLFRVLQESLNNIVKHADADEIMIELEYGNTFLNLAIADNGRGFKVEDLKPRGAGLSNMRKRALLMEGEFNIVGTPGAGTRVSVRLPIKEITLTQPEIMAQN